MTRPTKEQVDAALEHLDEWEPSYGGVGGNTTDAIGLVCAEVRALREELKAVYGLQIASCQQRDKALRNYDVANKAHEAAELRIVELRATIARVAALISLWKSRYNEPAAGRVIDSMRSEHADLNSVCAGLDHADITCARELEAALRGEP